MASANAKGVRHLKQSAFYDFFNDPAYLDPSQETCCCADCLVFGYYTYKKLLELIDELKEHLPAAEASIWKARMKKMINDDEAYYLAQYQRDLKESSDEPALCVHFALDSMGYHCLHEKGGQPVQVPQTHLEQVVGHSKCFDYTTSCEWCDQKKKSMLLC
jgi:hypothetical protein